MDGGKSKAKKQPRTFLARSGWRSCAWANEEVGKSGAGVGGGEEVGSGGEGGGDRDWGAAALGRPPRHDPVEDGGAPPRLGYTPGGPAMFFFIRPAVNYWFLIGDTPPHQTHSPP